MDQPKKLSGVPVVYPQYFPFGHETRSSPGENAVRLRILQHVCPNLRNPVNSQSDLHAASGWGDARTVFRTGRALAPSDPVRPHPSIRTREPTGPSRPQVATHRESESQRVLYEVARWRGYFHQSWPAARVTSINHNQSS